MLSKDPHAPFPLTRVRGYFSMPQNHVVKRLRNVRD